MVKRLVGMMVRVVVRMAVRVVVRMLVKVENMAIFNNEDGGDME